MRCDWPAGVSQGAARRDASPDEATALGARRLKHKVAGQQEPRFVSPELAAR